MKKKNKTLGKFTVSTKNQFGLHKFKKFVKHNYTNVKNGKMENR